MKEKQGSKHGSAGCRKAVPLSALDEGRTALVVRVAGEEPLRSRMLHMGLVPGTTIRIERKAPFNDPISVWFRGYELSLRLAEAQIVLVRPLDCGDCCGKCLA